MPIASVLLLVPGTSLIRQAEFLRLWLRWLDVSVELHGLSRNSGGRCSNEGAVSIGLNCLCRRATASGEVPGVSAPGVRVPGVRVPGERELGVRTLGVSALGASAPGDSVRPLLVEGSATSTSGTSGGDRSIRRFSVESLRDTLTARSVVAVTALICLTCQSARPAFIIKSNSYMSITQ